MLLVAAALVAAYLVFDRLDLDGSNDPPSDADAMKADVENTFDDFKTYQALKELYPEAYEELIHLTIKDLRDGENAKDAMIEGAEFTTRLRRENAQYYAMASVDRLRLSLNAQLPQFRYLKTAYGAKTCNQLAAKGGIGIAEVLGADFLKDRTLTLLMDEATGYFFRTTAEGQKLKLRHAPPTTADWQAAADYLKSKGMTDADIKLVNQPAQHLDDAHLCDAVIKFYETITTMDNDPAQRIVPYLAAQAAAG